MNHEEMKALVAEAVRDADLRAEEIPSIDLYLDQITSLMADKLTEGSERFADRVLTKTMINNYSKDGLISPINGKKYNKEQILQMLLVYSMKNTLSIGEIKRVLQNVYAAPDYSEEMLQKVWQRFLSIKDLERAEAFDNVNDFLTRLELDPNNDADFFTLLLSLSAWSSYLKNIVQALLEARYLDEEDLKKVLAKQQKEEKKAAKKAEKAEKAEKAALETEAKKAKAEKKAKENEAAEDAKSEEND
ncbi:MAG: DUF1836 domain-containing protein [Ruminococcaceae bacterium]|nr:DUF1836 domain-containing protein [Oscillospiraceae bacterium]